MKPIELILENIGPFKGITSINFDELGEMFLISGKTGAGKTTIFDAITFALYGTLPGARSKLTPKDLYSHYCTTGESCSITLEFIIKGSTYKVIRNPPVPYVNRNGKASFTEDEVKLYKKTTTKKCEDSTSLFPEYDNDSSSKNNDYNEQTWILISDKKTEADKILVQLMSLTAAEFSCIVLLPQGEFAQFLRQKSSERQQTLAKLFPISEYTAITSLVREKASSHKTEYDVTKNQILQLEIDFNKDTYKDDITSLQVNYTQTKTNINEQQEEISKKEKETTSLENVLKELLMLDSYQQKLTELESQEAEILSKKETLANADKASRILPVIENANKTRIITETTQTDLENAKKQLESKAVELTQAEDNYKRVPENKLILDKLKLNSEKLHSIKDKTQTLQNTKKEAQSLSINAENLKVELENDNLRLSKFKSEILQLKENSENQIDLSNALHQLTDTIQILENLNKIYAALQTLTDDQNSLKTTIAEQEKNLVSSEIMLREFEEQQKHSEINNTASVLANHLITGKPCPVCGSIEHPFPAKHENFIDLTEKIETTKNSINLIKETLANQNIKKQVLIEKIQNLETQKTDLQKKLEVSKLSETANTANTAIAANITSENTAIADVEKNLQVSKLAETPGTQLAQLQEQKTLLETRLEESKNALLQQEKLTKEVTKLEQVISEMNKEYPSLLANAESKNAIITQLEQDILALTLSLDNETANSEIDIDFEINNTQSKILELTNSIAAAETNLSNAKELFATTKQKVSSLEELLLTRQKESKLADEATKNALKEADFESVEAVRTSKKTEDEVQQLKTTIEQWSTDITTTKALISKTKETTKDENLAELQERVTVLTSGITEAKAQLADLQNKNEELSVKINKLETQNKTHAELAQKLETIQKTSQKYIRLEQALTGGNPKKIPFDSWVLGLYLDEITNYATQRLFKMSDGRYTMKLADTDGKVKGNGYSGLNIEIYDSFTGKTRSAESLSGGETFMASLSLALALTDVVQSKKGGLQLDCLFIDEGFGSLDENALENALSILDSIRGNRNIGLISHVSELQNRLPVRLEVNTSSTGSSIEIVHL